MNKNKTAYNSLGISSRVAFIILLSALLFVMQPTFVAHAATIAVNTLSDELNGDGDCSLREAIQAANTNAIVDACTVGDTGADTINVPAGIYTLSLAGTGEDGNLTGDLDITDTNGSLTIIGAGAESTFIEAGTTTSNGIDRVFDVFSGVTVTFEDVTIRHGRAADDDGGGIRISGGTVTLTDVAVSDNAVITSSTIDGGGIRATTDSSLTITGSTISGNSSNDFGGGIHLDTFAAGSGGPTVNITNSTISGNTAVDDGGGIFASGSTITMILNNVTIASNTSGDANAGGGIDFGASGATFTLKNTVVADNGSRDIDCLGTSPTITLNYSIIETAHDCTTSGGNNQTGDPNLSALADNGGQTQTHALGAGSIAINMGDVTGGGTASGACLDHAGGSINIDQRGAARAQGTNKGDSGCDIGSFEFASTQTPSAVTLQSFNAGDNNYGALTALLLVAGMIGMALIWRVRRFFPIAARSDNDRD